MAKNHEIRVYFLTNAMLAFYYTMLALYYTPPFYNSKCAGFQRKDAVKLESGKQIYI